MKGVRIVALCDVDSAVLDKGVNQLRAKNVEVTPYVTYRKLLESPGDRCRLDRHTQPLALSGRRFGRSKRTRMCTSEARVANVWEGRNS